MNSIPDLAIWLIIIAGICAVGAIVLNRLGVQIPEWVKNICWVLVVVFIGVIAIKFLRGLL